MNSLLVRVGFESSLAELSPNTGLLHASEGNSNVRIVARVDPYHTCLDQSGDTVCFCDVLREECSSQTIGGVVGALDSLLLSFERADRNKGAEDLLAVNRVVVLPRCMTAHARTVPW